LLPTLVIVFSDFNNAGWTTLAIKNSIIFIIIQVMIFAHWLVDALAIMVQLSMALQHQQVGPSVVYVDGLLYSW